MKVHLQVDGAPARVVEHTREIESIGADGLFTFEGPHDVFFPLVAASGVTDLQLMTNVAIAGPRSPMHLANAAYDLQQYSRGRFRLGLGSQIRPHIEKRYGSTWGRPAAQMGEWVSAVKAILSAWQDGTRLDFRGEFTTHTLMTPLFDPGPNEFGIPPVLLGALGPVMTRTAGEFADGLLLMPFNSARHLADRTLPALDEGFRRAGRTSDGFAVIAQVMVAVGGDDGQIAAARDAVANLVAFYASTPAYVSVLEVEGWADLQPQLNTLSKAAKFAEMRALITDEMVERIAVVGTPQQIADEVGRRFGGHADEVCCYFPGYTPEPAQLALLVDALHELGVS